MRSDILLKISLQLAELLKCLWYKKNISHKIAKIQPTVEIYKIHKIMTTKQCDFCKNLGDAKSEHRKLAAKLKNENNNSVNSSFESSLIGIFSQQFVRIDKQHVMDTKVQIIEEVII